MGGAWPCGVRTLTPHDWCICMCCSPSPQALAPVGALFGGANAGWAVDLLGRRNALMMVALPNLIGWLMISLANNCASPAGFKSLLLIGRFITGFAMGWSLLSSPVSE